MSRRVNGLKNDCPECDAKPGQACIGIGGPRASVHRSRLYAKPPLDDEDLIHRTVRICAEEYAVVLRETVLDPYYRVESPIEHALLVAFEHLGMTGQAIAMSTGRWDFLDPINHDDPASEYRARSYVYPQAEIGTFRADFLIVMRHTLMGHKLDRMIVVECDGHNFHSRTKKQVERDKTRDRYFAGKNVLVMRFAGSEIYRNPLSCATQVASACTDIFDEWHNSVVDIEHERWRKAQDK